MICYFWYIYYYDHFILILPAEMRFKFLIFMNTGQFAQTQFITGTLVDNAIRTVTRLFSFVTIKCINILYITVYVIHLKVLYHLQNFSFALTWLVFHRLVNIIWDSLILQTCQYNMELPHFADQSVYYKACFWSIHIVNYLERIEWDTFERIVLFLKRSNLYTAGGWIIYVY